jgi:hypothetical protein
MQGRQFQTNDFVNLAMTIPSEFALIYTQMTPEQCEEFVDVTHAKNYDFFCVSETRPVDQLGFIFENISTLKLFEILQQEYPYYNFPYAPRRYISLGGEYRGYYRGVRLILQSALSKFSLQQLIQLFFTPYALEDTNQILLPFGIIYCDIKEFKKVFSHPELS